MFRQGLIFINTDYVTAVLQSTASDVPMQVITVYFSPFPQWDVFRFLEHFYPNSDSRNETNILNTHIISVFYS